MNLRRGLMGMTRGWKQTKITAPATISLANGIKDWLDSLQISAAQAIVVRDGWDTMASANGTLIAANITNGVLGAYIRYYNNLYAGQNLWSSAYSLAVDEGDSYTVFYQ